MMNDDTAKKKETIFLSHGIKLENEFAISYVRSQVSIKDVIYIACESCYVILFSDGNLCKCDGVGCQEVFACQEKILALMFAEKYKTFVSVCADNNLRLVDRSLQLINAIPYSGTISGIEYNSFTHEVVTYGTGSVIVWSFRTAGTILIPKLIISDNISRTDLIIDISIERTSSEDQQCFSAISNGIMVHNLSNGSCAHVLSDIHNSPITNVFYFQPLKLLLTSSRDGCIKAWNADGSLDCIFIGHCGEITSLSMFPFGPYVMSTSYDGSLRTWSLDTKIETDSHRFDHHVLGVNTEFGRELIFSWTKDTLHLWKLNNLHSPFTVLSTVASSVKTTTNPKMPVVSYCVCDDACVRLICPVKGNVITVFISPNGVSIIDAVYHLSESLLIMLLVDGRIIEASTKTYPCSTLHSWSKESTKGCTSISLYEYMPESCSDDDAWNHIHQNTFNGRQMDDSNDKTMLFGGCSDGNIVVYEWKEGKENGNIAFSLQAHKGGVTALSANPKLDQLASTSKDKSLKVWRVFPFAEEALTPLLLFEHSMSIYGIQFSHNSLCVVYQDMAKAYHTLGIYNTTHNAKARSIVQDVTKDHTDVILSITACPRLHLIASSSKDGTVHIRNTENDVICVLALKDVAHSISFCSPRGNLLLAIGTNIHFIHYKQFLPKYFIRQMVAMSFVECEEASLIPFNECTSLTESEKHLLLKAHPSYLRFTSFVDDIPIEEQKRREEENRIKEIEFSILQARDEELKLIKDGSLKAKKYVGKSGVNRDIAFQRYLDLFYKRPDVLYPEDDPTDEEEQFIVKVDSSYIAKEDGGFFSVSAGKTDIERIKANLRKSREDDLKRRKLLESNSDSEMPTRKLRSLSIATDKVVLSLKGKHPKPPLSASTTYHERLQALQEHKKIDKTYSNERIGKIKVSSQEYPFNEVAKHQVNKRSVKKFKEMLVGNEIGNEGLPVAPDCYLPNSVIVALYKELRRESLHTELKNWKPSELNADQLAQIDEFNSKKRRKVETPTPSLSEVESEVLPDIEEKLSVLSAHLKEVKESISPVESEIEEIVTPPETPPPSPPPAPVVKEVKKKKLLKFVSTATVVRALTVTPPVKPELPPLPQFVLQFSGKDWYEKCFPDLNYETFEKPHTIEHFIKLLLNAMTSAKEYDLKVEIENAILLLTQQEECNEVLTDLIRTTIVSCLNIPGGEPCSQKSSDQMLFIKTSIQLLLSLKGLPQIVIVELMVQFILAPSAFRKEIMKTLEDLGVHDTKEYFPSELFKFDVSLVVASQQKSKLNELCDDWLVIWMKKLRQHIHSLTGKICRSSRPSKGDIRRRSGGGEKLKGILKKDLPSKKKELPKINEDKSLTFVPDDFVGGAADNISPIDAINYFCELMLEEECERIRKEALKNQLNSANKDRSENTVLCLPKIEGYCSLVRLGETHQSVCHPERETSLAHVLPPIDVKHGIRSLLLRVNTLKLSPYPDELDDLIYAPNANSDLITIKYYQKYFIPSTSFVPCGS